MSTGKSVEKSQLFLDGLEIGVSGTLIVMLCRAWDVNAVTNRYLSRDFVLCDSKGNTIHATARATVAHMFLKLKEGQIYLLRKFAVQPNKEEFHLYKNDLFVLEFDGETIVRKASVGCEGFNRYPFRFVELEELELTNNKYMIDVVGYVTNVGRTVTQRSGSRTLDFYLANSRGFAVRVTMSGALGDQLIEGRTHRHGVYPIVLVAVSVKLYNSKIYISSSSSTMLFDDVSIPVLQTMKKCESGGEDGKAEMPVDFSVPKAGTLENLLMWARNKKNDSAAFNCEVRIDGIRTKLGWSFPGCPWEKCRKQASRNAGEFWCETCERVVEYPVMRYRLELEVSDSTDSVVVVMFDEVAKKVVKYSVDAVAATMGQEDDADSVLPPALADIVGTTVTLQLTAQSYFEHGSYESFTCWKLIESPDAVEVGGSTGVVPTQDDQAKLLIQSAKTPSIVTPSKNSEAKKHERTELDDSDVECSAITGEDSTTSGGTSSSKKKLRKRYIVEDSD